jgi:Fur family transcriptional regulator, ferric uptake regulator
MQTSTSDNQALTEKWLTCLQDNGYRITDTRRVVVEIIVSSQRVLSPMEVYNLGRSTYPRLGLVTVYRTVEKLEELGLIQRVHQPTDCQAFAPSASGHQHLLICQECGRVEYFSGDMLDGLMAGVGSASGYRIREHWLQLFGVCSGCQQDN